MSLPRKNAFILPPPELRNIIDKTAQFVAKNGAEFEARIQENEKGNPRFCFLAINDPYRPYYDHKVSDYKNLSSEAQTSAEATMVAERAAAEKENEAKPAVEPKAVPKEPHPLDFIAKAPLITALDMDVIKLTALFVARNGKSLMMELQEKEKSNPQFEFLKATHALHPFFAKMIDEYGRVFTPDPAVLSRLSLYSKGKSQILSGAMKRAEYLSYKAECDKAAQTAYNKEKELFLSIDWHDFIVVETLDFNPVCDDTRDDFLSPVDEAQLSSISLQQKPSAADLEQQVAMETVNGGARGVHADMEAETGEAMQQSDDEQPEILPAVKVQSQTDYIPRALAMKQQSYVSDKIVKCAVCKALVHESELGEHIRLETLDPKYKEQRRIYDEKHKDSNLLQTGSEVARNLKLLATRRTDIFGKEEVEIGKRVGGEAVPGSAAALDKDKIIWDGSQASASATRAAQVASTYQRMVQSNQANQAAAMAALGSAVPPPVPGPRPPVAVQFPLPVSAFPPMMHVSAPMPMVPPLARPSTIPSPSQTDTKRQRIEDPLASDRATLRISVPNEPSLPTCALHGQTIDLPGLSLTQTTINDVKEKMAELVGLPNSRQKLVFELSGGRQAVPRNTQTLSEAGLVDGSIMQLSLKERGGKK